VEHPASDEPAAKKKSLIASEQTRPDVAEARDTFFARELADVPLKDVVVLDESYATTNFTRLRGRCRRDQRLYCPVPQGHWKTLTILGAITVDGVLSAASIPEAITGESFTVFIRDVLAPSLRPGMVVVMDNLSAHKVVAVRNLIESVDCRVVYLPPYSPDYSPIENIWSKVKQLLRTTAARTIDAVGQAVQWALEQVTPGDCRNCFAACGYTLHLE
jgi:transposase